MDLLYDGASAAAINQKVGSNWGGEEYDTFINVNV